MSITQKEMHEEFENDFKEVPNHAVAYEKAIGIALQKKEMIKSPKHYKFFDTEVIEIIRDSMTKEQFIGYCKGNSLKYRLRAGKKDDALQDLMKAEEYERYYNES